VTVSAHTRRPPPIGKGYTESYAKLSLELGMGYGIDEGVNAAGGFAEEGGNGGDEGRDEVIKAGNSQEGHYSVRCPG